MRRNRPSGSRRRAAILAVSIIVFALLAAGTYFLVAQPIQKSETGVVPVKVATSSPIATPTPIPAQVSSTPTSPPARECTAGWPTSFSWPDLGIVNAPIERIGSSGGVPDAPSDKVAIGIYREAINGRDWGHLPGEGLGNVIFDGHTYGDDSAVFKSNADEFIHEGSDFWFTMDNGSVCKYRVTQVWHQLAKDAAQADASHELFSTVAVREKFYDLDRPTEQLLGMTCSGAFNAEDTHHLYETAWFATPIN